MKNNELRNKLSPIKNYLKICEVIVGLERVLKHDFMYGYEMEKFKTLRDKEFPNAMNALTEIETILTEEDKL